MKGLFQCPPWARSFWAFSPYLNHMREFSTEHRFFLLRNSKIGFFRARISRFFILSSELTIQIPIRELPFKEEQSLWVQERRVIKMNQ